MPRAGRIHTRNPGVATPRHSLVDKSILDVLSIGKDVWAAIQRKTRLSLTSIECLIRIVSATAPKAFRESAARGSILTLRKRLFTCLLLISPAAGAQYAVTLHFPDHSIQVCMSTGYVVDFLSLDIDVTSCKLDTIFADGMGG